jgi:hypothetical protein
MSAILLPVMLRRRVGMAGNVLSPVESIFYNHLNVNGQNLLLRVVRRFILALPRYCIEVALYSELMALPGVLLMAPWPCPSGRFSSVVYR